LSARPILREVVLAFAVATAIVCLLFQIGSRIPLLAEYVPALAAIAFIYLPARAAWARGQELALWGFTLSPWRRNLAFVLAVPALVFPLFALVFAGFYAVVCNSGALSILAPPGWCPRFLGSDFVVRLPPGFLESAFAQLVVVAIPEELFFRGYLHARLEEAYPPARRILGGGVGRALLLSSLLFALGHVLVDFDPRRLVVFFPGLLFGWMRSASGSIAAGALVHALSNLYIDALHRTFFR
jgi:membrane protease YdiL (CAAX protease family)